MPLPLAPLITPFHCHIDAARLLIIDAIITIIDLLIH
jgi:hypothetical protein